MGLDKSRIPDWSFEGFSTPELTDEQVVDSWHRLKKHGVMLYPGGQLDQPAEWWNDMDLCDGIYNTRLESARDEKEAQSD